MRVGGWLMVAGVVLVVVGATVRFAPWLVSWFGRLPGDIRIESGSSRIFIPVTSMLLVSIVVSLVVGVVARLRG